MNELNASGLYPRPEGLGFTPSWIKTINHSIWRPSKVAKCYEAMLRQLQKWKRHLN